jgi:hypothetical protein
MTEQNMEKWRVWIYLGLFAVSWIVFLLFVKLVIWLWTAFKIGLFLLVLLWPAYTIYKYWKNKR